MPECDVYETIKWAVQWAVHSGLEERMTASVFFPPCFFRPLDSCGGWFHDSPAPNSTVLRPQPLPGGLLAPPRPGTACLGTRDRDQGGTHNRLACELKAPLALPRLCPLRSPAARLPPLAAPACLQSGTSPASAPRMHHGDEAGASQSHGGAFTPT